MRFIGRLVNVIRPHRADPELMREIAAHLALLEDEHRRRGLTPDEARLAARRAFNGIELTKDRHRDARSFVWFDDARRDVRYALRSLRRTPGFTAVAIFTLAVGVGGSTAIFSAVNPILFKPLPYPNAGRIVTFWDRGVEATRLEVTFGTYRELAGRAHAFEALATLKPWQPTVTGTAAPERLDGQRVGHEYFRVLGVRPALGRDFEAADDRVAGPNVVIMSDGVWRRRFGADPAIIGGPVTLNDAIYTVVGVLPPNVDNVLAPSAEIWAPLQYDDSLPPDGREWGHHLRMIGRLKPGVAVADAARDVDAIAHTPVPAFRRMPWASMSLGLTIAALQDDVTRGVRPALLAVLGAVLLVLAIACVNVTSLLLARGARRQGEFAMRAALGAGRSRLAAQLLTEGLVLALLGGVLGVAVAEAGVRGLTALSPPELPRATAIGVDRAALAFAFAVSTLVGLVVGLVPAWQAAQGELAAAARRAASRATGGHQLVRRLLVIAEVALALVLLVGAGLLLRSLQQLFAVEPGFDPPHVLTLQVQAASRRYADANAAHRFFDAALDAVRRVPGVERAALTSQLPLTGDFEKYGVQFETSPTENANDDHSALRYTVSPGFVETMGIRLRRGRLLDARDTAGAPVAVLISDSLAKRRFPGRDPVGQRLHLGDASQPWYTVAGVVADVKHTSLALSPDDAVYITTDQWYFADRTLSFVVRARGDAAPLAPAVRAAIWSVDKDQPIVRVVTLEALVARSAAQRRFALILFEAFAGVALLLAAVGLYGLLAGAVAERTREMGVRLALGASPADILALVVGQGLLLATAGAAVGVGGAIAGSRMLATLLFGISRLDPATYAAVVALLIGVAAIASAVPAWRAARVDPMDALRCE